MPLVLFRANYNINHDFDDNQALILVIFMSNPSYVFCINEEKKTKSK